MNNIDYTKTLPSAIALEIASYLKLSDLAKLNQVNLFWHKIINNPSLWKSISEPIWWQQNQTCKFLKIKSKIPKTDQSKWLHAHMISCDQAVKKFVEVAQRKELSSITIAFLDYSSCNLRNITNSLENSANKTFLSKEFFVCLSGSKNFKEEIKKNELFRRFAQKIFYVCPVCKPQNDICTKIYYRLKKCS